MNSRSLFGSNPDSLLWVVPIIFVCGLSGLVLARSPLIGLGLLALSAFLVASALARSVATRIAAPLAIALLIPADHIVPLGSDRAGFFYFGIALLLLTVAIARGRLVSVVRFDWLYLAYAGSVVLFCAIHFDKGAVRGALYWITGVLISLWLALERSQSEPETRTGIESGICVAGAVNGGLGVLEHLGLFDPTSAIPYYDGLRDEFSYFLGVRAVGLSGHPLCLGTITMLASVILITRLVSDYPFRRPTPTTLSLLACSFGGLVVSGARGSWIAVFVAFVVAITTSIVRTRSISVPRVGRIALVIGGLFLMLVISGFGRLIVERTVGSAVGPASIDQRVAATGTVIEALPEIPLIGVGPGAMNQFVLRWGLVVPNLESEYLIALLGFGPIGFALLLAWGASLWIRAFRIGRHSGYLIPLATTSALLVNLGTFNLLSWSAAAMLFAVIGCLSVTPPSKRSHLEPDDGVIAATMVPTEPQH